MPVINSGIAGNTTEDILDEMQKEFISIIQVKFLY